MEVNEFRNYDNGTIDFGKFKNYKWNDKRITKDYFEYIISDKCFTSDKNKSLAKKELINRRLCDGQLPLIKNI